MHFSGLAFRNLKVRTQILILTLISILIFSCFIGLYLLPKVNTIIEDRSVEKLQNLVDMPYGIVEKYYKAFETGTLSEGNAKAMALSEIKTLRYSGENYFWINDYQPVMVMHPIKPEMDGQDMKTYADPDGKLIFMEFANVVKAKGSGIVRYKWDKAGSTVPQPKMSYVKGFPEWNWIIGTGIYIDDLAAIQSAMVNSIALITALITLICAVISYALSSAISTPIRKLSQTAKDVAAGNFDVDLSITSNNEIGKLTAAFDQVVHTVRDVISETTSLDDSVASGRLNATIDEDRFSGGWRAIIQGLNHMAHTIMITSGRQQKMAAFQDCEVTKLKANLETLAEGNLRVSLVVEAADEDTETFAHNFRTIYESLSAMVNAMNSVIGETTGILSEMANKNLDVEISGEYKGDFIEMKHSINEIIASFNTMLGEINVASIQIASGADQVSESAQTLSTASTQQASVIEEVTASMCEVAEQTKINAQSATKASSLSQEVRNNAEMGNAQMKDMLEAMSEINASSHSISKIIKVIDEIAFQTNILALNAAVEAARAGGHGKGFAVVAEEVRNLAARSANAAKETTDLIEDSIRKVGAGTEIANGTSEGLNKIVSGISQTAKLVGEIATASNEQASAITQINQGIAQISQVIQTNSATAQESAAASEEMSSQAAVLSEMTSSFSLKESSRFHMRDKALVSHSGASARRMIPAARTRQGHDDIHINLDDREFGKY